MLRSFNLPRLALTSLVALLVVCITAAPVTHAGLLDDMSVKEERELGQKFEYLMRTKAPLVEDPVVIEYVTKLMYRLARHMPPQPWPISTGVLVSGGLNAFAGPAGRMFVFTGLIAHMEHEADLAGVLAHELGHVSARHLSERVGQSKKIGILSMLGTIAGMALGGSGARGAATAGQAAGQSAMLSFSREAEREADDLGLKYLVAAGYQPLGLVRAFQTLKRKSYGAGNFVPAYLTTHPALSERIATLEGHIASLPASIRNRPDNDREFKRIQALVRARYVDDTLSLSFFDNPAPRDCLAHMGRGIALERNGRQREARGHFESLMACDSNEPLYLREAGRFFFSAGDFATAGRQLQKAVMLDPKDMVSLFFMARIMAETGQISSAVSSMERVAAKHPKDAEVREHLGRMYGKAGERFPAHLNMAYAALYRGDMEKSQYHAGLAGRAAATHRERLQLAELGDMAKTFRELANP